jgi:thioredoxin-related protein
MKVLSFLIITAFFSINQEWNTSFEQAKVKAANENKLILLNFSGSDWCGPCIKLHKDIFDSEVFVEYAKRNLVLVNADFPRSKKNMPSKEQVKANEALAEKYNSKGVFPYTLLLDANGKVLKSWEGYPKLSAEEFIDELKR